jgi:hypothetical protein
MKFLLGLLSAALLATGLAAFAPTANAAPYPNTIPTFCSLGANAKSVSVRVRADGNRPPVGVAAVKVRKNGKVVRSMSVRFDGGDYTVARLGKSLAKGRYVVSMKADPRNDAYKHCSRSFAVRVR